MAGGALKLLTGSKNCLLVDMVDPIEEQKRQDRLDSWYEQDGRNEKDHPLHSLYTGLAEKYMNKEEANV